MVHVGDPRLCKVSSTNSSRISERRRTGASSCDDGSPPMDKGEGFHSVFGQVYKGVSRNTVSAAMGVPFGGCTNKHPTLHECFPEFVRFFKLKANALNLRP